MMHHMYIPVYFFINICYFTLIVGRGCVVKYKYAKDCFIQNDKIHALCQTVIYVDVHNNQCANYSVSFCTPS